jgi:hypothetical protein
MNDTSSVQLTQKSCMIHGTRSTQLEIDICYNLLNPLNYIGKCIREASDLC